MNEEVKLNELDKIEWREIYFKFKPTATEEEFEDAWRDFHEIKNRKKLQ